MGLVCDSEIHEIDVRFKFELQMATRGSVRNCLSRKGGGCRAGLSLLAPNGEV